MKPWLALAAGASVLAAGETQAQISGLSPHEVAVVSRTRALDLRLAQEIGQGSATPLVRGIIVRRELAPNATLGIGMSNLYGKRRGKNEWSAGEVRNRGRKPAITFVLRF